MDDTIRTVYLVHKQKYVGRLNWYKIGRTRDFLKRVGGYGKGTLIVSVKQVREGRWIEYCLKVIFNKFFKLVKGKETFEGNIQEMYYRFEAFTIQFIAFPITFFDPIARKAELAIEEKKLRCHKCNVLFDTKYALKQHLENQKKDCGEHAWEMKHLSTTCPRCKKPNFSTVYTMKTHFNKEICKTPENAHIPLFPPYQKNVSQPETGSGLPAAREEPRPSMSLPKEGLGGENDSSSRNSSTFL